MKHLSEIINQDFFYQNEWLLLGTGASLDNFNPKEHTDKNIAAIYAAGEVCRPDILFAPDTHGFIHSYNLFEKSRNVVTRAFNFDETKDLHYFEYDCDIKSETSEGTFHGGNGKRYFPFHEPFQCSCTAKLIANFFGKAGIKKIQSFGFDGGTSIFSKAPAWYTDEYIDLVPSFENERQDMFDELGKYKIEFIRL
ncbi:MAG: hypothetical protein WCP61_08785 [Chitinophagia bacterium]